MDTLYCPVCGAENPSEAPHCATCGVNLREEAREPPPLRWRVAGALLGAGVIVVLGAQFVPGLAWAGFRVRAGLEGMLFSDDGLGRLWWLALASLAGGLLAGALTGRRVAREARLAALGVWLVQLGAWAYQAELEGLFTGTITLLRSGFTFSLPSILAVLLAAGMLFGGFTAGASLGLFARERLSHQARCPACDGTLRTRPPLRVCPHCRGALARGKVRWGWVWSGAALSVGLYAGMLHFGGAPLQFYYRCELADQGDDCLAARVEYRKANQTGGENPWGLIQDRKPGSDEPGYFVLFHTWRYALYIAPCFFLLPLLLGLRLRRGALASAGLVAPLASVGAILCALFVFDFGSFEGALLYSLRYHVLDALLWSLAGSVGAAVGYRFGDSPTQHLREDESER